MFILIIALWVGAVANAQVSQLSDVDELVWSTKELEISCISFREDSWSGHVKSVECKNFNLVPTVTLQSNTTYLNPAWNDDSHVFFNDWNSTNSSWANIDSAMFWELCSGGIYSDQAIEIMFNSSPGYLYIINIIILHKDDIVAPDSLLTFPVGTIYIVFFFP